MKPSQPMTRSVMGTAAGCWLGLWSVGAWAQPATVLLTDLEPIDQELPRSVAPDASRAVRDALGSTFKLVPDKSVDELRNGMGTAPDLADIRKLLSAGQGQLVNFQPALALKSLAAAKKQLEPLVPQLRDYTPLTDVLLYTGYASMVLKGNRPTKESQAAFAELLQVRPEYRLDPAKFPPAVIAAFEKTRQLQDKRPRGRIALNSTPPGAKVFVDELPQGVTPATLPAAPGAHVVRLEAPGYLGWTKAVTVASYAKVEKQAALEKNQTLEALDALAKGAGAGAPADALLQLGAAVARGFKVRAVMTGAVGVSRDGYVISLAYLPENGTGHVFAQGVDRDLQGLRAAAKTLVDALATETATFSPARKLVAHAPAGADLGRPIDFARYGLGMQPNVSLISLLPKQIVVAAPAAAVATSATPEAAQVAPATGSSRWWLWTAAAVVVAGAAGGTTYYVLNHQSPNVTFNLTRQQ